MARIKIFVSYAVNNHTAAQFGRSIVSVDRPIKDENDINKLEAILARRLGESVNVVSLVNWIELGPEETPE